MLKAGIASGLFAAVLLTVSTAQPNGPSTAQSTPSRRADAAPKSRTIDTGEIAVQAGDLAGPFDLEGYDTISIQIAGGSAYPYWTNSLSAPYQAGTDWDELHPGRISNRDIIARWLRFTVVTGGPNFRLVIYLRRNG